MQYIPFVDSVLKMHSLILSLLIINKACVTLYYYYILLTVVNKLLACFNNITNLVIKQFKAERYSAR